MGIEKTVGKAALELAQNENVVNKTTDFLGMLFPFVGLEKKALDIIYQILRILICQVNQN